MIVKSKKYIEKGRVYRLNQEEKILGRIMEVSAITGADERT